MSEHNSTDDLNSLPNGHNGAAMGHSVPRSGPSHVSVLESAAPAAETPAEVGEAHIQPYTADTAPTLDDSAEANSLAGQDFAPDSSATEHSALEHSDAEHFDAAYHSDHPATVYDLSYQEAYDANHEIYTSPDTYVATDSNAATLVTTEEPDLGAVPELAPLADGGWGGPPDDSHITPYTSPWQPPEPETPLRSKEQDLFEHLGELRARLLACVYTVGAMMVITWNFGAHFQAWVTAPVFTALARYGPKGAKAPTLITLDPTDGLMIYFQMALIFALLLSMPILLYQLWRFIEPALTHAERRYTIVLVPFSVGLFVAGVAMGYYMSPLFFRFFLAFQPPGTQATFSYANVVILLAKMLLVFGICFQVPVITIFVNKIGLVSRNWMIEYWRHVVVVIFSIVAIITPTWDPVTLIVCSVPPCLLYLLSLWIIKWL